MVLGPHSSGRLVDHVEGRWRCRRQLEAKLELLSKKTVDLVFGGQCRGCWVPVGNASGFLKREHVEPPAEAELVRIRRFEHVISRHLRFEFFFNLVELDRLNAVAGLRGMRSFPDRPAPEVKK